MNHSHRPNSSPSFLVHPTHFSTCLFDRPRIGRHVRRLCIVIPAWPSFIDSMEVSQILPQISNLSSITLKNNSQEIVSWNKLNAHFCAHFVESLRLSSLKEVCTATAVASMGIYHFPVRRSQKCRELLQRIGNCLESQSHSPFPLLEVLRLNCCGGSLPETVPWVTGIGTWSFTRLSMYPVW